MLVVQESGNRSTDTIINCLIDCFAGKPRSMFDRSSDNIVAKAVGPRFQPGDITFSETCVPN